MSRGVREGLPRRHPRIKHLQFAARGQGDAVDQLHDEPHLLAALVPVGGLDGLPVALGELRGGHHLEDAGSRFIPERRRGAWRWQGHAGWWFLAALFDGEAEASKRRPHVGTFERKRSFLVI